MKPNHYINCQSNYTFDNSTNTLFLFDYIDQNFFDWSTKIEIISIFSRSIKRISMATANPNYVAYRYLTTFSPFCFHNNIK